MKISRTEWLNILMVIMTVVIAGLMYDKLPDPMPTHWNAGGTADGFTPKPWGPFVGPLMMLGIYLLFLAIPAISPRGFRIEGFQRIFTAIKSIIIGFMFALNIAIILIATGFPVSISKVIPIIIAVMFILLGNLMGKITKNFFVGIRTPWTLASDEVWLLTHRLGGKTFVIGGFVMVIEILLGFGSTVILTTIIIAALIPVVYSYVAYRRIEGFRP